MPLFRGNAEDDDGLFSLALAGDARAPKPNAEDGFARPAAASAAAAVAAGLAGASNTLGALLLMEGYEDADGFFASALAGAGAGVEVGLDPGTAVAFAGANPKDGLVAAAAPSSGAP